MADAATDYEPYIRNTSQDIRKIIEGIANTTEAKAYMEGYTKCEGGEHERRGNGYAHWQIEIQTKDRCRCKDTPTKLLPLCWGCLVGVHTRKMVRCGCKVDRPYTEVLFRGQIRAA